VFFRATSLHSALQILRKLASFPSYHAGDVVGTLTNFSETSPVRNLSACSL
jgi:hypothetical protein